MPLNRREFLATTARPGTQVAPSHQLRHHARRRARRVDARHLLPSRRQDIRGSHRAARELPAGPVLCGRRSIDHHADVPRVRDACGSPGRAVAAHAGVGPSRVSHAGRGARHVLGTPGVGVNGGQASNPHPREPVDRGAGEAEIVVRGAAITQARWTQLASTDITAHNTFEAPETVRPTTGDARVVGGRVVHTIAPASVTRIGLTVG